MMKLIIDILEEEYDLVHHGNKSPLTELELMRAVANGTPLQEKPGKWIDKKMTIKGGHGLAYGRYGCSVCKKKQPSKSNFCPNCGADMREREGKE